MSETRMDVNLTDVALAVEKMTPEDRKVLGNLEQDRPATPETLAANLYVLPSVVHRTLSALEGLRFVVTVSGKRVPGYVLTDVGQMAKGLALFKESRGILVSARPEEAKPQEVK